MTRVKTPKLNARKVWARQQLSKLLSSISEALSGSVIRVKWSIKPIATEVVHRAGSGPITPFAYSSAVVGAEKLESYRVISRHDSSAFINSTTWTFTNLVGSVGGIIVDAEDARVFQYNNQLYIYFQIAYRNDDGSQDCRIYVFDPRTSKTRLVDCPFRFSGKNWIPYEESGDLHFIYSLQPLIVLKVIAWGDEHLSTEVIHDESNFTNQEISWGDEHGSFGAIRGGSQLLQINDEDFIGFTHVTPTGILKFSHQAGVILFNSKKKIFTHKKITKLTPGLLIDPFGIEISGDEIRMIYSSSVNNPHETYSVVGSSVAIFKYSDLLFG